jgi:hypothetical protein
MIAVLLAHAKRLEQVRLRWEAIGRRRTYQKRILGREGHQVTWL